MFLPVLLKTGSEKCLVVGGGAVALRKARWLLESGAQVEAVSPRFVGGFEELRGDVRLVREPYASRDLSGYALAIAATDDREVNRLVAEDARAAGVPVNVADAPDESTFYVPATVRRGPLVIATATGGEAPALSARIREELERAYPEFLAPYVRALGRARRWLAEKHGDAGEGAEILKGLSSRQTAESLAESGDGLDEDGMFEKMREEALRFLASGCGTDATEDTINKSTNERR